LNFVNLFHGFVPPEDEKMSNDQRAEWLYNEMFGDGSGGARSATDRTMHGIYFFPGSGTADIHNVGGAYVFTNKTANEKSYNHVGSNRIFKFDIDPKKAVAKLGLYGNSNDEWGKLSGNQFSKLAESNLSEVMLKGEVLYDDVRAIRVKTQEALDAVISYFQSKGISQINGVPLTEFFILGK
jgi:hypothetical protein